MPVIVCPIELGMAQQTFYVVNDAGQTNRKEAPLTDLGVALAAYSRSENAYTIHLYGAVEIATAIKYDILQHELNTYNENKLEILINE